MSIVHNILTFKSIQQGYRDRSTISGTSVEAIIEYEHIVTGNQKLEPKYFSTFDYNKYNNLETPVGLGLIKNVIVDQYFLK